MSGSVLLDTNIVIGLFAKDQAVLARLSESARVFIPSIVVGELYFGAYKSTQPKGNVHRIEELVAASAVLVCDATTAEYYGRIKKALRDKGRPLPEQIDRLGTVAACVMKAKVPQLLAQPTGGFIVHREFDEFDAVEHGGWRKLRDAGFRFHQ